MEEKKGLSRRELLKLAFAGTVSSMLPFNIYGKDNIEFKPSKGLGLIFIVGDGMPLGVTRATHEISTRVWNKKGTNLYTLMSNPRTVIGYMGTKSLSSIVTDSAPASAAWSTGSKVVNRMLACLPDGRPLKTIMELLKEKGFACGLVTTTRITHATPAAFVSHNENRDAEDEIAMDYLKFKPDVLLGGGNKHFDPSTRKDGKDLFSAFIKEGYEVVKDKISLLSEGIVGSHKPILGIFSSSHMSYYVDRLNIQQLSRKEPTLPEMTAVALNKLSKNPKGFILQVEAGRIDHANHSNDAWAAIMDTFEMDLTLKTILDYMKSNPNTLVIITSDHGNSGWGINGTGPEYMDSTEALTKYAPIKASFETMIKEIKGKSAKEIQDIFEYYTTYKISNQEAEMITASMQPDYMSFPGDFVYQPDAVMGKILCHSIYNKNSKGSIKKPYVLRRGNVGFTSTNHTGEDQIIIAFGHKAKEFGLGRFIDNTQVFHGMCRYFGIKYKNPSLNEDQARSYIKVASLEDWQNHLKLHIS
ncbi:MAG TPA: alkaline phosphatase [Syntrophorhabdaceae bacterium]|nr:alkaline phosphatase [Syntrophorhabdaceae bacterium]